ncbi:peptidyl-prolyl cis-trans isomerase D [Saonia flava]|uniref:Periplasmic chaperone PpiD n=1 Tax=Saonia flava TaxID=523696 RepID=A0A846R3E9_9FLAO|nr:SurA N-terminal domain-containing protein [Saonia flava]NJB71884.1 peptidyl-prolyl cis-trans isomerase D [Saonia flava]
MAILENIRKRTTILILIIGMALFAFVISGIFTSNDFGGAKVGSSIAEVNGTDISVDDFRRKVESASRRYGASATTMQVVNNVWNQEIRNAVLGQQFEELGINIEQDQIINFLKSNPSYSQNPQFVNEDGVFDENVFREFVSNLKENLPAQYELWLQDEQNIIQQAKEQTYFNLVKAGIGATLKEGELDYKLANDKVDIQYVRVPYTSIPDSSISISKKEIDIYINEHEDEYKQESARDLQYVFFEEKPSMADENAVKEEITKLLSSTLEYNEAADTTDTIPGFSAVEDVAAFLDRNSDTKFDTIFKAKTSIPSQFSDSIMALNVGETYGPYREGDFFRVARMMAKKPNGNVKASHILITYEGAERANPEIKRTKDEAEKKANELLKEVLKSDVVFAELARENSDGPSAPQGGDLGYFQDGVMTPKFNDFAFGNRVGHVGLVETEFGFHIVKVDDKQDLVQVATLSREVEPSEETINTLFTDATKFEMESVSSDNPFTDLAKERDYVVRPINKIKAMDESLPGLSTQRAIVQWAFNPDSEVGDIKRFDLNNGYAVVQLTKKYKEGLMSVEDASVTVLPKLRKKMKAEQIIANNTGKAMDAFAKDNNVSLSNATALTMKSPTIAGAGREPVVVGTAFAMGQDATSHLIEGETGVFLVKVTKKEEAPKLDNYVTYANTLRSTGATKVTTAVYNALKEASEIEDNRTTFY